MLRNQKGFTLGELMIAITIIFGLLIVGYIFLLRTICMGNFWFTEDGVLREIKINHPVVTEVLKSTKNIFSKSVIVVKEGGEIKNYCLDSDVFFNYEVFDCK